jgi:hypothetical protein
MRYNPARRTPGVPGAADPGYRPRAAAAIRARSSAGEHYVDIEIEAKDLISVTA